MPDIALEVIKLVAGTSASLLGGAISAGIGFAAANHTKQTDIANEKKRFHREKLEALYLTISKAKDCSYATPAMMINIIEKGERPDSGAATYSAADIDMAIRLYFPELSNYLKLVDGERVNASKAVVEAIESRDANRKVSTVAQANMLRSALAMSKIYDQLLADIVIVAHNYKD